MLRLYLCLLIWSLSEVSLVSSEVVAPAPLCQPSWLLFGERCYAFFPVWSSWSTARTLCSQTGGTLMLLNTPEEKKIINQLTNISTPVWLGGYKNDPQLWSNDDNWTDQAEGKTKGCRACMQMTPKTGELLSAPCGELMFYICTSSPRFNSPDLKNPRMLQPGIVPGVLLFDLMWDSSSVEAEGIFHSSSLLRGLMSGNLTERCYTTFIQLEELYLHRVTSTLEVLINALHEDNDLRSLLLDILRQYRRRKQGLQPSSPPPQWLQWSLQSFHRVVLEEPVYWLVALSARACLQNFLVKRLHQELGMQPPSLRWNHFYQQWMIENMNFVWVKRYSKLIKAYQDQMDPYKAINIFREHMMNQKSLHKALNCENERDEEVHSRTYVL